MGALPIDERVYRNLKLTAQTSLGPAKDVRTLIGPVFPLVFDEREIGSKAMNVPVMLSQEGLDSFFLPESESVSDLALIDSWVLGQTKSAEFSDADKQDLKERIREFYVIDYTNTWRNLLNGIEIKNFRDISEAVDVLENLTGNSEPLQRLLVILEENTQLFPEIPEDKAARDELQKTTKYGIARKSICPLLT